MSFTSKGQNEILLAGCQESMFKIEVEKGTINQTVRAILSENLSPDGCAESSDTNMPCTVAS